MGLEAKNVGTRVGSSHIYIYAVELKAGPRFWVSSVKNWSKSSVKNWSKFFFIHCFFPKFIVFFWVFLKTQIVSHCAKIVFLENFGDVKNEVFKKKIAFFVGETEAETEKRKKMEKAKKPHKNSVFLKVVIRKCEKSQRIVFFCKNCLTLFVSGREKNAHFRAQCLFGPKILFAYNTVNQEKLLK